jgi:hypothetical protein
VTCSLLDHQEEVLEEQGYQLVWDQEQDQDPFEMSDVLPKTKLKTIERCGNQLKSFALMTCKEVFQNRVHSIVSST